MNVNIGNIGKEEQSFNITNINLSKRFNKTREIIINITQVLTVLLTIAATSASLERVNCKECVPNVRCSIPAASYAEIGALCSVNPANV